MAQGKTKGLQKKADSGKSTHAASRAAAKTRKGGRAIPPKQKALVQKDALRKVRTHTTRSTSAPCSADSCADQELLVFFPLSIIYATISHIRRYCIRSILHSQSLSAKIGRSIEEQAAQKASSSGSLTIVRGEASSERYAFCPAYRSPLAVFVGSFTDFRASLLCSQVIEGFVFQEG